MKVPTGVLYDGGVGGCLEIYKYLRKFIREKHWKTLHFCIFPYKSPPQAENFGISRQKPSKIPLKIVIFHNIECFEP